MKQYLQGLNAAQHEAVVNYKGASLIVAGAGSGKTRVLTTRIAHMIDEGVEPYRILALTFTNKAAAEMRERIATIIGPEKSRYIWMGTFHSIFLRILREEADKIGFDRNFSIYDSADSKNLLKNIIKEMNLSDEHYKPGVVLARISLAKNNLVTPEAYMANTNFIARDREQRIDRLVDVYVEYARRCKANSAMDFDDMLLYTNILLRDFPEVTAKYQMRFQYLLVDEYQDTNYAQYVIIRRLAQQHANVCVVGDDAQSIYSFRGAKIENILRFRNDYPEAQTFKLEQNYRSTQTIVDAANSVIRQNSNQIKKDSFSEGEVGVPIKVHKAYTDQEEAAIVADNIRGLMRDGAAWSDMAILYRTNMQSRAMEEALRRRGVPYKIYSGTSFYQRKEIKDMLAYIRLVVNPSDNEAFERIINYPARGLGDVTLSRIAAAAETNNISLFETVSTISHETMGIKGSTSSKLTGFVEMINGLSMLRAEMGLYQFGMELASRSGILSVYKVENSPESQSALDNIEELLNSMQTFSEQELREESYDTVTGELILGAAIEPTIDEWLQNIALMTDQDNTSEEEREKVTMMTIHAAKGLEFRYVFIVGLEENLFPSLMSFGTPEGLEEERRLFYVALTRAKEAAFLTFAQSRFKWGKMEFCSASRFLSEIDPKFLDIDFDLAECGPRERPQRPSDGESGRPVFGRERSSFRGGKPAYPAKQPQAAPPKPQTPPVFREGGKYSRIGNRIVSSEPAAPTTAASVASGDYDIGMNVEHGKFGRGVIVDIEAMANDRKITVDFGPVGQKTLLAKFAKLQII